jgi:hypothetical protein
LVSFRRISFEAAMRHLLLSLACCLVASFALAADDKADKAGGDKKPGEPADNSGFDRPEFKQPIREAGAKPGNGLASKGPASKSDRIAKILAGLEPKEAPKPQPMQPMDDPAAQILTIFQQLDQDANGLITRGEYRVLLDQAGDKREQLQGLFFLLDSSPRDERISAQEARQGAEQIGRLASLMGGGKPNEGNRNGNNQVNPAIAQMTQATLAKLDANGNGRISRREAGDDPQAMQAFAIGDTNQDRELSGEEIYAYFARQAAQAQPPGFNPGKLEVPNKKKKD